MDKRRKQLLVGAKVHDVIRLTEFCLYDTQYHLFYLELFWLLNVKVLCDSIMSSASDKSV